MTTFSERLWQKENGALFPWRCVVFGHLQDAREEHDEQHRSKVYTCSRHRCSWRKYPV